VGPEFRRYIGNVIGYVLDWIYNAGHPIQFFIETKRRQKKVGEPTDLMA
jgi:hypothetical protein